MFFFITGEVGGLMVVGISVEYLRGIFLLDFIFWLSFVGGVFFFFRFYGFCSYAGEVRFFGCDFGSIMLIVVSIVVEFIIRIRSIYFNLFRLKI